MKKLAAGFVLALCLLMEMADAADGVLLSGTITDAATDLPVAGAAVSTVERYRVISNEDGAFKLLLVEGDEKYKLTFEVKAPGDGVARELIGEGAGPFEWNVALERSLSLTLRVMASAQPAPDAKVVLDIGENTLRLYQRTDAAGYCTFTELPRDLPLKAFAFHSTLGRGNWSQSSLVGNEAEAVFRLPSSHFLFLVLVRTRSRTGRTSSRWPAPPSVSTKTTWAPRKDRDRIIDSNSTPCAVPGGLRCFLISFAPSCCRCFV